MSQIKALENYQLAHSNDIKIVHEESNHLRDRMDSLEEKNSVNNLANYSAIALQFQEQMGYLRASSARRSISPINFNQRRRIGDNLESTVTQWTMLDNTTSHFTIRREKMAAPTFQGERSEKPIKFLKEMRRYLNPNEMSLNDMKIMLSQNLKGSAASWWYVVENSIQDFEDFEEQYKEKFWSEEITDALVRKIEYGVYTPNGPLSRVDYTIELMSVAQDLEKYTEEELVKKLVAHHDMDIRFMAKSQGIKEKKP